jgi:hypothetical protein
MKVTGYEAIDYAQEHALTLNKYTDPTEEARTGLGIAEATEIAAEDPSLIYVEVQSKYVIQDAAGEIVTGGRYDDGRFNSEREAETALNEHLNKGGDRSDYRIVEWID